MDSRLKKPMGLANSTYTLPNIVRWKAGDVEKRGLGLEVLLFWSWAVGLLLFPFIEWMVGLPGNRTLPIIDVWMLGVLLLWIFFHRRDHQFRFLPLWMLVGLLGFVGIVILSAFNAPAPAQSIFYLGRFVVLNVLLYVWLPLQFLRTREQARIVINIFVLAAMFGAGMGLISLLLRPEYIDVTRATPLSIGGMFLLGETPNLLAELLLPAIPMTWALLVTQRDSQKQRRFGLLLGLFVIISLLTFSRAAWISLGALGAPLMVLFYRRRRFRWSWRMIAITGLLLLPLLVAMIFFLASPVVESSNNNRFYLQAIGMRMFERHPWVGSGIGTFIANVDSEKYYQIEFGGSLDAHGIPQKMLAETGVLGLMTFLLFLGSLIFFGFRLSQRLSGADRVWGLAIGVSMLALLVSQMFNTTYYTAKLWVPMGVGFAMIVALFHEHEKPTH